MKWFLKWLFRLLLLAVVLVVIFFLSLDTIIRVVMENRIRAQTGMDAEIGKFTLGLAEPTITIKDFKLFNPPSFGGTPFLDIKEIHVEYDRAALAKSELHVTLLRFNLAELDIVKNSAGETNIFSIAALPSVKKTGGKGKTFTAQTGLEFTGIDVLNVSVGKAQFIDLKDQHNNREQVIGIENCVTPNVKSQSDLAPLVAIIVLRSDGFFNSLVDEKKPGFDILKQIGL
ncbi:MAG: hypothetical protein PHY43_05805 [Verrucomicrobiales bacterium]|nr:hypothetical protein [Verrucomicrobiales bacterium]